MKRTVHKFGGTSVAGRARLEAVAALMADAARGGPLVVVASAMAGVTDALLQAAAGAAGQDPAAAVADLVARHHAAMPADDAALGAALDAQLAEVGDLLRATMYLRELTPRTRDRVVSAGERLSVRLLAAALRARGVDAVVCDADAFLDTDARFGAAAPLPGVAGRSVAAALGPHLDAGRVPVVTGFCGRSPHGATTTLGRGGSDYTATLVAHALEADEVIIWTDVPGVFTADPRTVPGARRVDHLNYREAAELSFYGAKVLHPRTLAPIAARGIPVRVVSTFEPDLGGTLIDGRFTPARTR